MPATVTLVPLLVAEHIDPTDSEIKLVVTDAGQTSLTLVPDGAVQLDPLQSYFGYCEGELMRLVRQGLGSRFVAMRGLHGTSASHHDAGAQMYLGLGYHFYNHDPLGSPPNALEVSPWINVLNGTVWFAQGDSEPGHTTRRWWVKQEMKEATNSLGVREFTLDPIEST